MFTKGTSLPFTDGTADIHFSRWFCKRKIRRAETHLGILSEKLLNEMIKCLLEVCKRHPFVHIEPFYLVKKAMGTCRNCFVPIYPTRHNCTERRFPVFHHPNLNR